jgi:hypothetical protein
VLLRALNPADKAFGVLPTVDTVDTALKAAKAPTKKALPTSKRLVKK